MKFRSLLVAFAGGYAGGIGAQTLNVVTAGDQNMVDYVNNYLAPKFEAMNPGVKVRAVGTGPGDSGSQKIYEKLSAQQKAGNAEWDVDVAVVHQRGAATMVNEKLLMPYRADVSAGKLVSRDTAKNALGANVDGYVLPMFHSQIAFAESPDVQAEGIVKQFNWYPGIDPQFVQTKMDQASWNKLFTDISPADLSKYGRPFPLSPYFKEIVEGYERV